jgi:hypothetical protein
MMNYQDQILACGEKILNCPNYPKGGACHEELADIPARGYQHGPEIAFVGEEYGLPGAPRILFTRLNPTWNQETGWFGTRESIAAYRSGNPHAGARDVFQAYLRGWDHGDKVFRGMRDAGTVTGHPNKSLRPAEEKRSCPRYGIQVIMEEMVRAGVFPATPESPLEFCAINNVVKCAGALESWNPSSAMYTNCNWYEAELGILAPHMLVVFGNDADRYMRRKLAHCFSWDADQTALSLEGGKECRYFVFPHPLGPGKNTWRGDDIRHLTPHGAVSRDLGRKDEERFRSGPCGGSTARLFRYTLYLVSQAVLLKECTRV